MTTLVMDDGKPVEFTMPEMDAAENKFVKLTVSPTFGDIIRMTGCCEKYCTLMIKPVEILAIRKVFVDLFDEMFDGNRKKRGEVHRFFLRALDNKREADGTIRVPGIRNLVCPKVAAAIVGVPLNMLLSYTAKPNEKTCCDCGCRV